MPFRELQYQYKKTPDGARYKALASSKFRQFKPLFARAEMNRNQTNPDTKKNFDALVASFDLEGFTPFCNQHDAYLSVLPFIDKFLGWLFSDLAEQLQRADLNGYTLLWARLPVWEKFTGDGVMLIWDVSDEESYLGDLEVGNIIYRLQQLCARYISQFLPEIRDTWKLAPKRLRCGVARGNILSVASASDFVGGCINLACRLQKVQHYSFACASKGLEIDKCFKEEWHSLFRKVSLQVRGIGEAEPAFVLSSEYK